MNSSLYFAFATLLQSRQIKSQHHPYIAMQLSAHPLPMFALHIRDISVSCTAFTYRLFAMLSHNVSFPWHCHSWRCRCIMSPRSTLPFICQSVYYRALPFHIESDPSYATLYPHSAMLCPCALVRFRSLLMPRNSLVLRITQHSSPHHSYASPSRQCTTPLWRFRSAPRNAIALPFVASPVISGAVQLIASLTHCVTLHSRLRIVQYIAYSAQCSHNVALT